MAGLVHVLCLVVATCASPAGAWSQSHSSCATGSAAESVDFTSRGVSASEVVVKSDLGIRFDEGIEIESRALGGSHFVEYESTFRLLRTGTGEYIGFERIDVPTDAGLYGSEIVRLLKGTTVEAVGGQPLPASWVQPAQQFPIFPGFRYVASNRIIARADSHRYVGLWQAETGSETLVVAFDEPSAYDPNRPPSQILARLPFKASVISTTSAPHGGPTALRMVTDPDRNGRFWLVNLLWPTSHAEQ